MREAYNKFRVHILPMILPSARERNAVTNLRCSANWFNRDPLCRLNGLAWSLAETGGAVCGNHSCCESGSHAVFASTGFEAVPSRYVTPGLGLRYFSSRAFSCAGGLCGKE